MATAAQKVTLDDLFHLAGEGKAELVDGRILRMSPTGRRPGYAGDSIMVSLWQYARQHRDGVAVGDNKGFRVDLPTRETFSPDAAYYIGENSGMRFYEGAPIFAVEVRSENDYGQPAEQEIRAKRADYFAAGTRVVWDVDLNSEEVVRVYRADNPNAATLYRRGDSADAEPAVPGWRMPVDDLFEA